MNVIRYEPFSLVDQVFNGLLSERGLASDAPVAAWTPRVDVKEEATRFVIHADIPGVDPKDIEITLEEGVLTLKGERKSEARSEQDGWTRVERVAGSFSRRFTLPETVDADGVVAKGEHGVLEIVIPKQAKVQPRKIQVRVN
jgi:HSP20 family protein